MSVSTYVKRPVEVEAIQFTDRASGQEILDWIGDQGDLTPRMMLRAIPGTTDEYEATGLEIPTLEGVMICAPLWWVIKGVQGEFYPCAPDIFEATYDPKEVSA